MLMGQEPHLIARDDIVAQWKKWNFPGKMGGQGTCESPQHINDYVEMETRPQALSFLSRALWWGCCSQIMISVPLLHDFHSLFCAVWSTACFAISNWQFCFLHLFQTNFHFYLYDLFLNLGSGVETFIAQSFIELSPLLLVPFSFISSSIEPL